MKTSKVITFPKIKRVDCLTHGSLALDTYSSSFSRPRNSKNRVTAFPKISKTFSNTYISTHTLLFTDAHRGASRFEYDFYVDAVNPVGFLDSWGFQVLGIHSNVDPATNPGLTAGHAWLSYTDPNGNTQTFGLWPDDHSAVPDNGAGSDVRVGMENNSQSSRSRYYTLTPDQIQELQDYINTNTDWTYTHTCASWASDGVAQVVGEDVDADDILGFETPREISESIDELEANDPTSPTSPSDGNDSSTSNSSSF